MDWFEDLTGFVESAAAVRAQLMLDGEYLTSRANGRRMRCGRLELPSLGELRRRVAALGRPGGRTRLSERVGDVRVLHAQPASAGAMFQVASQFNLLEMVGPSHTPEEGVTIYQYDRTQGPACAMAAAAGLIYRNYFVPVDGEPGQRIDRQLDTLADLGEVWDNDAQRLWRMRNGYALPSPEGLAEIDARLASASEAERDGWRALLRIGLQWDTEVTLPGAGHTLQQAYCSALPVAYSGLPRAAWARFATLVLEAAYEATFAAALLNAAERGDRRLYLTLLGGGAFGNDWAWIITALDRALGLYGDAGLEVRVVSYGAPNPALAGLLDRYR
ncbi:MAG: hypothetical protein MUE46_04230 [Xanthomonadales bacterium]|jgi:hypothetical protein|nr:hypothetical protein [Xanthomonadales bacterium]